MNTPNPVQDLCAQIETHFVSILETALPKLESDSELKRAQAAKSIYQECLAGIGTLYDLWELLKGDTP